MKRLFTIALLLASTFAEAGVFPLSTEMQIGRIKNLVDKAPHGLFLTVGGERSFRGASMFEGIEHLIIFDISSIIIKYNKINIELLKAPTKEIYKNLRWEADLASWKKTSLKLTEEDFSWWKENIRSMKGYALPEVLNKSGHGGADKYLHVRQKLMAIYPKVSLKFNNRVDAFLTNITWQDIEQNQKGLTSPITRQEFEWFAAEKKQDNSCVQKFIDDPRTAIDWGQVIDYKSGNYLFDDRLYKRLHDLAIKDKISIVEADLTSKTGREAVVQLIKKAGSKLAVVDMDNLYRYEYMGEGNFRRALSALLDLGAKDSILILMNNYKDYPSLCAQFSIYVGFTFEHVKSWPKEPFFDAFINSVPSDIQPLLDGKLYEAGDEVPLYIK